MVCLENEIYKNTDDYIIIYPPMWFIKKLKRWYNHSEIIAKTISKELWIVIEKNLIKKVKNTKQQSKLNRIDRLSNLSDSFIINNSKIKDIDKKIVIIVDDVVSTWSTVNEIWKLLKKSWYKKIIWLIIASD